MPGTKIERSPGVWRLMVSAGRGPDGKYKRKSKTFHGTAAAAERELAKFYAECTKGNVNPPNKMTMAELCKLYMEHVDALIADGNRHKSAPRAIRPAIWKWIAPELHDPNAKEKKLGRVKVSQVDDQMAQEWVNTLKHAGLSPRTVRNYASIFSSIMNYARKDLKIIEVNPCRNLSLPTVHKAPIKTYTSEEFLDIVEAIDALPEDQIHYVVAFQILLFGGLRRSEVAGLNEDDVNYENNTITVRRARQYLPGSGLLEDSPKSAAGIRTLSMPKEVMESISRLQQRQKELKERWGSLWRDTPALIKMPKPYAPKKPGDPVDPKAIYRAFKRLCKSAGVPAKGLHALRHTHASIVAFLPETTWSDLQHRIGHAELSTTLNIYTHLFEDHGQKVADALSAQFLSGRKKTD